MLPNTAHHDLVRGDAWEMEQCGRESEGPRNSYIAVGFMLGKNLDFNFKVELMMFGLSLSPSPMNNRMLNSL